MFVFEVILVCIFPAFSRIRIEYGEILSVCISSYSVLMLENAGKIWTRITPNMDTFYTVLTMKYLKYSFVWTTINSWKKSTNAVIGRANPLDSSMLKKVKDIAFETRTAGGVINRSQLISIAAGVGRANKSTLLIDFGGDLVLTEKWAKEVLEKLTINFFFYSLFNVDYNHIFIYIVLITFAIENN